MTPELDWIEIDWLKKWNEYTPDNVALHDLASQTDLTYKDLYQKVLHLAESLDSDWSIKAGDRVALMATNKVESIVLFFALQRLKAILVPINFRFTQSEALHILNDCQATLLIHDENISGTANNCQTSAANSQLKLWNFDGPNGLANLINSISGQPAKINVNTRLSPEFKGSFEDPVMILYTSGTTGFPKGAVITHKMIYWNSINTGLRLNLSQNDISLSFLPLFHTGGWNVLTTPLLHRGAKIVFLEKFDPEIVLQLCESQKISILFGVPTTMGMMARSPSFNSVNLESVRYAIVGGEPMPQELIKNWHNKGIPIRQGYGLTEFGPNVFSLNEDDAIRKIGSIGFANFYVDTKVIDENGEVCQPDQVGELLLRGPMSMQGYWNNLEATKETIQKGWLHTGDLVRKDIDGYFYVIGRKKEMFISGGENVYPAEVEKIIYSYNNIKEVAVVGVKDPQWGEVGKAFLSLKSADKKLDISNLQQHCHTHLAKFKVPKYFQVISELPKSDSGKILKRQLLS